MFQAEVNFNIYCIFSYSLLISWYFLSVSQSYCDISSSDWLVGSLSGCWQICLFVQLSTAAYSFMIPENLSEAQI